jgi:RNA polymerase sigma-70 factor (ECF subfamily)
MSALPSIHEPVATPLEADRAGALYEEYSDRILGYCLRRLPSREEAEDAVQHTFLNAYRGLRQGVIPRSDAAWLFKIAENVCRERRRSAWRRSRVETVQDPEGLAGLAIAPLGTHDELAGLADALAELSPNQRRAILLREWQGLSYREIAEQLGLTEGAVETLLFRARRSLAGKLDRSRGGVRRLGSVRGWSKSLGGGAATKVAVTALVVGGVLAAASVFGTHHPQRVAAASPTAPPAVHFARPAPARTPPAHPRVRRAPAAVRTRPSGQTQGTVPRTRPNRTVASPTQAAAARPRKHAPTKGPKAPAKPAPVTQTPSLPAYTASDTAPAP